MTRPAKVAVIILSELVLAYLIDLGSFFLFHGGGEVTWFLRQQFVPVSIVNWIIFFIVIWRADLFAGSAQGLINAVLVSFLVAMAPWIGLVPLYAFWLSGSF